MSSFSSCVYIISSLLFNLLNFSLISLYWDSATFSQPHIIENIICYVCNKVALTQCIYCELCNTWIHQRCIKMTVKTFNLFSISPLPFFCNICISSILPFTTITDKAFSKLLTVKNTQLTLKKCFSCSKSIRLNQNEVFCSLGQHSYHQSCLKIKTNELKKLSKNWSCNSCNAFPFQELTDKEFLSLTYNSLSTTYLFTKLIHTDAYDNFIKYTPNLFLEDNLNKSDEQVEINVNFAYYHLNKLLQSIMPWKFLVGKRCSC